MLQFLHLILVVIAQYGGFAEPKISDRKDFIATNKRLHIADAKLKVEFTLPPIILSYTF